jgi:hypothetical protein
MTAFNRRSFLDAPETLLATCKNQDMGEKS